MFPVYIDSANITSITRLAETDRIRELGMQLLWPHFLLMRTSLAWFLLSHADELPARPASQPVDFAADKGPRHMASFGAIRSIIGILIFMVMTQPDLFGIKMRPSANLVIPDFADCIVPYMSKRLGWYI
jgi:hypothetical protein